MIRILTDSASDILPAEAEQLGVTVIPLNVTLEDGTGVVHTAPAFGEDDYRVCKDNGLPFIQPVDAPGRFTGTPRNLFRLDSLRR